METEELHDIDFIFTHLVGGHGFWQWRTTMILFPFTWISGYPLFLAVFATYIPNHRCLIPECEDIEATQFETDWTNFSIPRGN